MKVQDLMTSAVETCSPTTNLAAVAMLMSRYDCGIIPVVDRARRVVGVLSDRDICMAVATRNRRAEELTAGEVATGKTFVVHPGDDVRHALELMRDRKVRRLPVVDPERRIQGMLSLADVVLVTKALGGRPNFDGPTPREVIETLKGISERPVSSEPTPRNEALVATHA